MTRTKLFFAFALVFLPVAVLTPAPAPTNKLHLAPAGTVKVGNLFVHDAALIDENRIVIVGRTGDTDPAKDAPSEGLPNGAIISLATKSAQPFTNQHTSQMWSVSSYAGQVVTGSTGVNAAALLRIWDLKGQESQAAAKLDDAAATCHAKCFHKSGRIVVDATEQLVVLDPAKPQERMELACPPGVRWLSYPLAISPDDAWIACLGDRSQVVCFEVATKKATVVAVTPKDAVARWSICGLTFSPSGKLFVCRHGSNEDEVRKGKEEKDVPAERRGIVRIDLPEGKLVPLNMGHTCGVTDYGAIDGQEKWLATVGSSRPDKQVDEERVGELRVYNLASGKLAYREQLKEGPEWAWFTPSGKRLVCVTTNGIVRWWDVLVR